MAVTQVYRGPFMGRLRRAFEEAEVSPQFGISFDQTPTGLIIDGTFDAERLIKSLAELFRYEAK